MSFGITQVNAVTPNYFDVTIDITQIYLYHDGDPGWLEGRGEIYFKIKNRGGVTLLDTIGDFTRLGKGEHDIDDVSLTAEHYVPGLDYFIIEMWDKDPGTDDLLFRGKLFIKVKSTEGIIYYLESNSLWLEAYTVGIYNSEGHPVSAIPHGTDRTYASFYPYDFWYWPYYALDNHMWIEVTIDYYYSSIG